ncbi:ADP-ribosylation factor GTPase-activating protein 3 isoform X2 [Sabethes cyaneus]|uniref:ADP-ribosylation factor GTPase-activating protein 3 isoform X2 n=1 Tax=Sabethes cyaneus TaxID=53552 RepID=UPI00237ECFFB|nr:ADP-ribosylation factor GTPase-activating protein 3 isoform X2 [Sabethes cyaneus]
MAVAPEKNDLDAIFNRLRSIPTNKTCFDCGSKNPTWSSVTYGVFICIDCSAVHRSLGVHLTFVRSTNLDTNWTWLQIRQMQLGGNAKAAQFFRQHNCNTTDAQQKYNSRAAQLYRDKLANQAQQSLQLHGTTLHIDNMHDQNAESNASEEIDFFTDCASFEVSAVTNDSHNNNLKQNAFLQDNIPKLASLGGNEPIDGTGNLQGPSVDFLNSTVPVEPPKSTIGVRKIQPKKGALGGKKGGLGATRVKTNFAEIEEKANLADKLKMSTAVAAVENPPTEEEQAQALASVRLAYQDLSIKQHKEEEKLKATDPNKAKQVERLGMGFGSRTGVSHSAVTDMKTLSQETVSKNGTSLEKTFDSNNDFFDDYATSMYGSSNSNNASGSTASIGSSKTSPSTGVSSRMSNDFFVVVDAFGPPPPAKNKSIRNQPTYNRNSSGKQSGTGSGNDYEPSDTAQKKFGSAKGISSDQFFGDDSTSFERSANLAKFQDSSSISSADYFGHGSSSGGSSGGRNRGPNLQYNGPDLDEVKESVRQSVTKVAGRLSTLATDMMSTIQDKYGY